MQGLVLAIAFFPGVAILAPLFLQFTSFGIVNTYWAMIIPDLLFALPLTVYLLVAYFQELPADLEEAAKVDGCTTWQAFWKVTVPLSLPGVITTGILTFIFAWSEFLFANTFAFDQTTQPATVVIPNFATQFTTDYGAQAAGALAVTSAGPDLPAPHRVRAHRGRRQVGGRRLETSPAEPGVSRWRNLWA